MLEILEGRVVWEKTEHGIRMRIPARRGPFKAVFGPLVAIWLVLEIVRSRHQSVRPFPEDTEFMLQMIAMAIYVVAFFYFVAWLVWTLTGDTLLALDSSELRIQTRVLGIDLTTHAFPADQVSRLRFVPPFRKSDYWSVLNRDSSSIEFEAANKPHTFAKGVTETEARALIDKMLQVYQFPRSWF
ncbi:MAG: hypothetical protein P4L26_16660 [Terracidiphilus sp.]|nr:hypothetical protein [Terracidiphilus sp.]